MGGIEGRIFEEFSPGYYGICAVGGMLSAGATHLAVTPLDVLKVNMQVNPIKYHGLASGLSVLWREQGPSSLWRGWSGKLFGYGIQGGCKFGLYEYFKKIYSDLLVDRNSSLVFFLSGTSAQVFADVALCPFEAVKVRVQAQPSFAKGLVEGIPKLRRTEGLSGYASTAGYFLSGAVTFHYGKNTNLGPSVIMVPDGPLFGGSKAELWSSEAGEWDYRLFGTFNAEQNHRAVSMVMFSTFEHSVDLIYQQVLKRRKEECSRTLQLGVTCLAGYTAGAVATVVSTPADNIVASLYNRKAENVVQAVKDIGFVNMFRRSLPVRIMIGGPVITLQWFLYDTFKVLSGLPTSGGIRSRLEEEANLSS